MPNALRAALAAAFLTGAAATAASAVPPPCELHWEPFASTSPGFPVHVEVERPSHWTC